MEPYFKQEIYFPGTVVERQGKSAKEFLDGLFFATRGLMLSQVREITALETSVIQNWVNRGWVQKPVEKRYTANHLTRILLINMLRDVTKLETIVQLLTYLNGSANCREDDSISESQLYLYLCDILDEADYETILSGRLDRMIEERAADYREPFPGGREKVVNALKLILTYYAASRIKVRADRLFKTIIGEEEALTEKPFV